jgi:hypothetical protein
VASLVSTGRERVRTAAQGGGRSGPSQVTGGGPQERNLESTRARAKRGPERGRHP